MLVTEVKKARPVKIAVVDDDESVRDSLLELFESVGYEAATFSSAEEFLKWNHLDQFVCLILDVRLPGMSGPELYRKLKKIDRSVPTVFITAHVDGSVESRILAQGAEAFLYKPFKPDALLDSVRTAVARSRL